MTKSARFGDQPRKKQPQRVVHLYKQAARGSARFAALASPLETGGILLGWRTETAIEVVDVLEVRDPNACRNAYERNHQAAEYALAARTAEQPGASPVGYVGEWHSHGAALRHSWQDRRELRALSALSTHTIAMLVVVKRREGWVPHTLTAFAGRIARARVVKVGAQASEVPHER